MDKIGWLFPTILTGIFVFVSTNIDDLLLLTLLYSSVNIRKPNIVIGQYLGSIAIILLSIILLSTVGFFGKLVFPLEEWIGFLGLVPIMMGIIRLRTLFSKHEVYYRIFPVSRERAWAALTRPEQISQWFEPIAYVDLRVGGEIRLGREQPPGEIEVVEPPHRFAFRWHAVAAGADPSLPVTQILNTLEEFTLKKVPGGTHLTLVQSGFASLPVEAAEPYLKLNRSSRDGALTKLEHYLQGEIPAYKPSLFRTVFGSFLSLQTYTVAFLTIANGFDNISTYVPLFASGSLIRMGVLIGLFLLLAGIWCYLGYVLAHLPAVARIIERYGRILLPFVFIMLGILVLVKTGTVALLFHMRFR